MVFASVVPRIRQSRRNTIIAAALALVLIMALIIGVSAAMSGAGAGPIVSPTASPGGSEEADKVEYFVPGGTAEQNKPFFDYTNRQTIALAKGAPVGQSFIDALVAGGFDRNAMQLTPDTTAADLQADSIQFSVQIGEQCLIGQWGTGSNGYRSEVAPVIPGIGCLIGKTRPIDW